MQRADSVIGSSLSQNQSESLQDHTKGPHGTKRPAPDEEDGTSMAGQFNQYLNPRLKVSEYTYHHFKFSAS